MKVAVSFLLLICCVSTEAQSIDTVLLKDMTTSLAQLGLRVSSLQRQAKGQDVKLKQQEAEITRLRKQIQGQQVAFSASLLDKGHVDFGHFHHFVILVLKHAITNIGNAYNPNTGVFTAPVKGAYHFEWHVAGHGHATGAVLVKNEDQIFISYEAQGGHLGSSSQSVSLPLEAGDVVFLRVWPHTQVFDNINHHTTFSGHLLFTM